MIKFVLMVNKMGQTRVSSYYEWMPIPERVALEAEVVRRCFSRSELQCSFFEFRGYKIIYRRVRAWCAFSLYFFQQYVDELFSIHILCNDRSDQIC